MPVRFYYVDESYDQNKFCLTAMGIRHSAWNECFDMVKQHRVQLKRDYGLYLRKEIHATDFTRGKGRISDRTVSKWERSRIFFSILELISRLPDVEVFNVCLSQRGLADAQMRAWERLTNRIDFSMARRNDTEIPIRKELIQKIDSLGQKKTHVEQIETRLLKYKSKAMFVADEGREKEITAALRKMSVVNYIPSRFSMQSRNVPVRHVIEDPVFKESHRSYFLQLADCIAFALLKREVEPTKLVSKYEYHKMFDQTIASVCFRRASTADPLGIVR